MQRKKDQTQRILDFYVGGLSENKCFDRLKNFDFLDILSKSTAIQSLDEFVNVIKRVAEEKGIPRNSMEFQTYLYLQEHWHKELKDIRKCVDCYEIFTTNETDEDYFTRVCTKPHLLVYVKEAKHHGPRMWPVKVLSVAAEKKIVTVEFFGDHDVEDFTFDECFLYSNGQEIARKKANEKYSKDAEITKQDEYKRSFSEVKKYIENIKDKYGSFVPAATKVKITNVEQHLMDMFPGAFSQRSVGTNIVKSQVTPFEEVNNAFEQSSAGPSWRKRSQFASRYRRILPSLRSNYDSDSSESEDDDDDDADDDDDYFYQRTLTPIELHPVDIKIEQEVENNSQSKVESTNESQVRDDSVNDDSITGEQGLDGLGEDRKRKKINAAVVREHQHRAKKVCRASEFTHSSQANDSIVDELIVAEGDSGILPTSSQNPNESATSASNLDAILDEFFDVKTKITKLNELLEELNEQEVIIRGEIRDNIHDENVDVLLDKFREIIEKRAEREKELQELNEHEAMIRANLRKSIK